MLVGVKITRDRVYMYMYMYMYLYMYMWVTNSSYVHRHVYEGVSNKFCPRVVPV